MAYSDLDFLAKHFYKKYHKTNVKEHIFKCRMATTLSAYASWIS